MYHYTYMTVDENSGKYYVGRHSTENLFDGYKGSGKWVRNYPKTKRSDLITYVLEFFNDASELKCGEQKLLNEYFQKPLCMNFNNKSEGWATGENNPTNLLTEEQKKYRSENHWTKTEEGSKWVSENNPSKMAHVKILRSETAKDLWTQESYREKYIGDNHWVNQETTAAKLFLDRMSGKNNPAKAAEVRETLSRKSKEQAKSGNFSLRQPDVIEAAVEGLRNRFKNRLDSGLPAFTDEHIKNLSKPQVIVECPHCSKSGGLNNMKRYHFDNCKNLKSA